MSDKCNPIIQTILENFDKGNKVVDVHWESYSSPQIFHCIMDDGSHTEHSLEGIDHEEFVELDKEARRYWKILGWSGGNPIN